jgi:hypothetical protein
MVKPKWLFAVAIFIFKRGSLSVFIWQGNVPNAW